MLPWNYQSINGEFFLQVKSCQKKLKKAESTCCNCCSIETNVLYQGIVEHMINGIKENTTFTYQPISGLITLLRGKVDQVRAMHLTKLNDSRKLVGKAAALEDHKQWILAVANGKVNRVAALVQAGLKNHAGIRGLIADYEQAALRLYCPKGYSPDDIM